MTPAEKPSDRERNDVLVRLAKKAMALEKPRDFDPFGHAGFAHLWLQYD